MTFVDTGAWFASVVPTDRNNAAAVRWLATNRTPLQVAAGEGPDRQQQYDQRVKERPDDERRRRGAGRHERDLPSGVAERQEQRRLRVERGCLPEPVARDEQADRDAKI